MNPAESSTTGAADLLMARAVALDAADPLADRRELFDLDPAVVYLDGNSLGALSHAVTARVNDVMAREWGRDLIASWDSNGWWRLPERLGDRVAPLLGAGPGQVVVSDSTSVNTFKLIVAGVRMRPGRSRIVVDDRTFPTNGYIADAAARMLGVEVTRVDPTQLDDALGEDVALVMMNHVDFRVGELWDMPTLTRAIHACGAVALWDVCHSVGVVPLALDALEVELAVGCGYKFLNGGPGAPSFLYVRRDLVEGLDQPLQGWHGHADPFGMPQDYVPDRGISRARVGTPDILSMSAFDSALDAYDGVDLVQARAKTRSLSELFIDAIDALLPVNAVQVVSPRDPARRAGQVSVAHPAARQLMKDLAARGVVTDFREPDVIRFGFSPLYVRHVDAVTAALAMRDLVAG